MNSLIWLKQVKNVLAVVAAAVLLVLAVRVSIVSDKNPSRPGSIVVVETLLPPPTVPISDPQIRSFVDSVEYVVWIETANLAKNSRPLEVITPPTTAPQRREVVAPPSPEVSQQETVTSGGLGDHPFLVCTRRHESDTAGGYRAVSPSGTYRGAYQFHQATWDTVAGWVGRPDLIGVPADQASPADQDLLAYELWRREGNRHWEGRC